MINKKNLLYISVMIAAIALLFRSTLVWLFNAYVSADTYYSHGFLIPFVSGYLILRKRDDLMRSAPEYNGTGLCIVAAALLAHIAGVFAGVNFVSSYSLFMIIAGIILFLFGRMIIMKILFPICFLIFMFPLPLAAINAISFPMKMCATKSAVFIMKEILNLPLQNEGFQIFFPNASLVVGNPCSGLRSLITMLALGSIFAYLLRSGMKKKGILFLLSIPIALLSNIIRVIMLGVVVFVYGAKSLDSFFHDFSGYFVFVIAFSFLWYFWRLLDCKVSK